MTALLREGLRELGLDESRAETLERFAALLLKKNEVMNLTAITEPEAVAQLHLLDSAALTRFVDLSGKTVVDVGTGAGFPGMPLRILKDDFDLTLLDSLAWNAFTRGRRNLPPDIGKAMTLRCRAPSHSSMCSASWRCRL